MKNFTILMLLALTMATGSAFSFEGNRGPPIEDEKITFADVLEQSNRFVSLGWEAMQIESVRFQEEDFFLVILYQRSNDQFAYATGIIENFNNGDFQDLRYTILSQRQKTKPKLQKKSNHYLQIGSAKGVKQKRTWAYCA